MTHNKQTKIVATIGPASSDPKILKALVEAGVNVFRLNFSHGSHDDHRQRAKDIRALEKELGKPIGILADMQGPKLRLGTFANEKVAIKQGQTFRFDLDPTPGDETRVNLPHPEILSVLKEGDHVYLDDGNVRARVTKKGDDYVETIILAGSKLSNRKGLNVPDAIIPIPALTEKDREDLKVALDFGADWIAQSFVQTPEDVKEAQELIEGRAALMVKIEKPSALEHIEKIVELADGVMLARGDLGVETPAEDVPATQKQIVRFVRDTGKPMVVATQMLESMITSARPTRAEASDVATAVYDGADAVMLSAETAAGSYPVEAVEMMAKICQRTESDDTYREMIDIFHPDTMMDDAGDAITTSAYYVAEDIHASLIATYTASGSTALRMARQRPAVNIMCITPDVGVARRLCVSYGVQAFVSEGGEGDFSGPALHSSKIALENGLLKEGEKFVITAGVPFGTPGTTNVLRIAEAKKA